MHICLYQINCAFNWCTRCPSISMHPIEQQLLEAKMLPYICPIHTYGSIWTCSEHGVLAAGEKSIQFVKGTEIVKKVKVYSNIKLVSKSIPFQLFFNDYYLTSFSTSSNICFYWWFQGGMICVYSGKNREIRCVFHLWFCLVIDFDNQ